MVEDMNTFNTFNPVYKIRKRVEGVKVAILDPSLVLCLWPPALDPPMGTSGMLWPPALDPPLGMQGVVICGWRLAHVALCDV